MAAWWSREFRLYDHNIQQNHFDKSNKTLISGSFGDENHRLLNYNYDKRCQNIIERVSKFLLTIVASANNAIYTWATTTSLCTL